MIETKIDAIVAGQFDHVFRLFGELRLNGGERLCGFGLPAKAKPFLVCPAFEEGRAQELLDAGPFGKDADVLTWQEDESPFAVLGKGLADRGLSSGTVGLDENMKLCSRKAFAPPTASHPCQRLAHHRRLPAWLKTRTRSSACVWHAGATLLVYRAVPAPCNRQ